MYIHHITLTTGHSSRVGPGDITGETLARVRPWLAAMIESRQRLPLPVTALADYSAHASADAGALVVTVSGPSGLPIVTMGVAARSRHAVKLWDDLVALSKAPCGIGRPSTPWCAVMLWPAIAAHIDAADWLGDLERCIAWSWVVPEAQ